ncbi:MAG: tol-pal system protein YbgF [Paracoccaceae bacterium]
MRRAGGLVALALVLGAAPLAAPPAPAQDLVAIDRRIDALERELQRLRVEVATGDPSSAGPGAPTPRAALSRLDALETELRALTGRVERLENRVDRLAEDAARRFYDLEFRLTEAEGGDIAALPAEPLPLGDAPDAGAAAAAVSVSERRAFEDAIALVQRGRVEAAEAALDDFLGAYPASPLAGAALYWQGEARFARGDARGAARAYLDGFQADPDGERAAESLMRLGVSLGRLGRTEEACSTLDEVPRRFPGEDRVVEEAAGEAARLGCG